ncbi:hypothetical protein CPC16_009116 [Podila verticillata]|nr:hypothetical protein BGZ52_005945 [Haplosporangium bisporale]KAF9382999.1 hypothetical protein CPC16_009116 [Podila verticillata]
MRLSLASIALLVASAVGVASAQDNLASFGICTCFNPKFDASCCILARGFMQNDGNVCDTLDATDIPAYQKCCSRSGGKSKCKTGYRDPSHWPPADSYGCKA